jgi:SAM-dependent methyltransferase
MSRPANPWRNVAKDWDLKASPFKPHRDDTAAVERVATTIAADADGLDAVILGVTAETVACAWPRGTRLRAFDRSQAIIDTLWGALGLPDGATVERANWVTLPLADGSVDLVTGDGSLSCVELDEMAPAIAEVARILRPRGRFVIRTFLRPEDPETVDAILADLDAGRIGSPSVLKMRMTALVSDGQGCCSIRARVGMWRELFPDPETTASRLGWPLRAFIEPRDYADKDLILILPTLAQLHALLAPHFREIEHVVGGYELGERSPTLVLEPL